MIGTRIPDAIVQRVDKGAAFLDAQVPGWYERVNIEGLYMHVANLCIIGQLLGNFVELYELAGDYEFDAVGHGFDANLLVAEDCRMTKPAYYKALERAWTDVIRIKRGENCNAI